MQALKYVKTNFDKKTSFEKLK